MKNRLDLINLLEKYQKHKFVSSQYEINENYPFTKTENQNFIRSNAQRIRTQQDEDYQLDNYNKRILSRTNTRFVMASNNQYYMARSQCQKNLQQLLSQLNKFEYKIMEQQKDYMKNVQNYYQKQLLKCKGQIIDRINQMFILQLKRQKQKMFVNFKQKFAQSFDDLKLKITNQKQQIKKLLVELNKKQYKPIIAQIVMKDFGSNLNQMQKQLQTKTLSQIKQIYYLDNTRLNCIKIDLQNIFQFNYNNTNLKAQPRSIKVQQRNIKGELKPIRQLKAQDKIVNQRQYFNQNLLDRDNNSQSQSSFKNRQMSQKFARRKSIFQRPNRKNQEQSQNQRQSIQSNYMRLSQNKAAKKSFFNFNQNKNEQNQYTFE